MRQEWEFHSAYRPGARCPGPALRERGRGYRAHNESGFTCFFAYLLTFTASAGGLPTALAFTQFSAVHDTDPVVARAIELAPLHLALLHCVTVSLLVCASFTDHDFAFVYATS